jgi:hypothetical protein
MLKPASKDAVWLHSFLYDLRRKRSMTASGIVGIVKLEGKTSHLVAGLNADQYAAEMRGQLAA